MLTNNNIFTMPLVLIPAANMGKFVSETKFEVISVSICQIKALRHEFTKSFCQKNIASTKLSLKTNFLSKYASSYDLKI